MSTNTRLDDPLTQPLPSICREAALRLLVVEDSDDDYELLLSLLRKTGFRATGARVETEQEMKQALADAEWDLVISDDRLPQFSASAALAVLQNCQRDLPFIILSGSMVEDEAVAAMLAGADDYISKSKLTRLVPAIERSVRAAESRRRHREAERSLSENELRLRALAANVPGMLFEFRYHDGHIRFLHVNAGSQSLLGIDPTELVATPELLMQLIDTQDRNALAACLEHPDEEASVVRWEGRARLPDRKDNLRWIQLGASPRRDESGEVIWAGIITDISALKQAEADASRSRDELRALSAHLEMAREAERARIAREIHDDIGGTITALRADIAWIKNRIRNEQNLIEKLNYMDELVESAAGASMRIVGDLRPAVIDHGLVAALDWLAKDFQKHAGVACHFSCNLEEADIELDRATAIFRIFQELLTNITKHAAAQSVRANLLIDDTTVCLTVRDDGVGIVYPNRRRYGSFGIRGMQERVHELGGSIDIRPAKDGGTLAILRARRHSSTQ